MLFKTFVSFLFAASLTFTANGAYSQDEGMETFSTQTAGKLFTIKGSNTIGAKLAPAWVKHYLEAKGLTDVSIKTTHIENEYRIEGYNGDLPVFVDIHAHGSGTGYSGLADGSGNIAMSSRPIKDKEAALLQSLGDMRDFSAEKVVAIDGLAVIVNRSNPVSSLTVEQIAKVFSGEISNWSQLGGGDMPIRVYARDDKSGTWDTFKSLVLGKQYSLTTSAERFESNDQLSDRVSTAPGGIGFVGLASVRRAKALGISEDSTDPLKPEPLYVATEDYPLARRLFMYVAPKQNNPLVNEFIHFVQSTRGQEIVNQIGFISQNPLSLQSETYADAPQTYKVLSENALRLSVNFRFKDGSAELDNKAKQDILRIVRYMQIPENADKRIQLVGFGDSKETAARSTVLSKLRAVAVKSALYSYGISSESVLGLGSDLPVASNAGSARLKNQRVEVWVFDTQLRSMITKTKKDASREKRQAATLDYAGSH